YNAPILTVLSDGRLLMLWVDDLGTKNVVNKTSLMYSIYDGTVWSTPLEIHEVGTYNGEPVIYNDGTNVHIVWNRAKSALADDAGLEELVEANEIYYTCFDGNDFSTPVAITDNALFEINYSVVSSGDRVAVAWIENSDNDPISSSGTNSVYTKECIDGVWQAPVLVASYTQPVSEIAVYYNGDELCCAYTLTDAENNSDIYINSLELTEGEYMSYEDGYIYYLSDSSICKYDTVTGEIIELGIDGVSNFSISEGNLYTLVSTGFTCEMYESICTDGVYSDWKQVTEYDRYIRNYSVTTDSTGEPIYALNLVSVDEDAEEIYGNSELAVCKAETIEAIKATAVYYDYNEVKPSADLELNVDVANIGNTDFDTVTVQILDADGNILSSEIVDARLAAGETTTLKTVYTLPAELTKQDIYVNVIVSDNERELSDNTVYTTVGYGDIAVNDLTVEKTENGAVVKGTVTNVGYTDISDVNISVYNSSIPDEIISTISCGDISVGSEYSFEYDIPEKYLTLEDKMTMYGLTFKAEATDEESNYANNSDKVVFGELTDYTVTFVDGNEILNVLSVDEFESYIPEKEGYTFVSWHTSPFLTDVSKVTEISDDISENIMVYAKWKDVPVVTVENYNVTITLADEMNAMRYASGEHTTASSIKNAADRVDLSASVIAKNTVDGKFVYTMPDGGYYTFWVRMSDGTEYFLAADMTEFIPTVETYGVKVTVDGLYDVKDCFITKGEFNTYNEIKENGYIVRLTAAKIDGKHNYTYTVTDSGMHTVLVRYNDGREFIFHEELTVDEPVFTTNGLQVTISNIPDVKVIRTAYGEYDTPGDTKRAPGARNFSNKSVIKDAEEYTLQYRDEGRVTIVVEYNNGYVKVFHYDVTKKTPTVEQQRNNVTLGNLDGLVMVRYAMGKYATSTEIKKATGSKVIKPDAIADGKITVTDLAVGTYTFCVQFDDESYNYYVIIVE
ncbi:MAG: InlB B-repeat-containing protein, partial [Clostridia bacterium]|nr:InlB B-repeat-containing protein [Clostridia bacterium]